MSAAKIQACIIGWPVAHSRSPLIHGYWLEKYGIHGSYTKRPVQPDEVAAFFRGMREEGFAGCNVTIPHKEGVIPLLDEVHPAAKWIGAVKSNLPESMRTCSGPVECERSARWTRCSQYSELNVCPRSCEGIGTESAGC